MRANTPPQQPRRSIHYNYFRDYDAAIGRYIQSDPAGLKGGYNTFVYGGASPLSNSDTKGLWVRPALTTWFGLCAILGYVSGTERYPKPTDDKKKHCYASCIMNKCMAWTFVPAWGAGWAFEQIQRIGGPGIGLYDEKDLEANLYGVLASYRGKCDRECDACPIK